jgi:hypothetical protein
MRHVITIPAAGNSAGVYPFQGPGKIVLITATDGAFRLRTNLGDEYNFDKSNQGFGDENSAKFSTLTFYNDTGVAVNVTFYVSDKPIKSPDVNVTSNVTATATLTNTLANCAAEADGQFQAASGPAGAAARFAAVGTYFRQAFLVAQRSLARVPNTGSVYIGVSNAAQPIELAPGDRWEIQADTGGKRDFGSWWVSADVAGDGLSIIYV